MTRVVVNPSELRRIAGVLGQCASDDELGDRQLRTAPLPELPVGLGWVGGELQAIAAGFRRQALTFRQQADDLSRRAARIESDQMAALAWQLRPLAQIDCTPIGTRRQSYWDGVEHRAGLLWRFAIGDDLHTIDDSHAPAWDRGLALFSILPVGKALKGARLLDEAVRVERDAKRADEAARAGRDAARVAVKSRYTLTEWRAAAGSRAQAARELEHNMTVDGLSTKPAGYETHHLVAAYDPRAEEAQKELARWGIRPNDAANGVYLPGPKLKEADPLPAASFHRPIHTNLYYDRVALALEKASSREDAVQILARIRRQLEQGRFP